MGQGPEGVPADAEAVAGVLEADGAAGGGRRGLPGRGQRQGHTRGGRGPISEPAPRQESQVELITIMITIRSLESIVHDN